MIRITDITQMQQFSLTQKRQGKTVGFVPTMGFLHDGHLSLVDESRSRCDIVVVSIYVNPTQFGPNEDLDNYPRDLEGDEKVCEERGVDVVFYPSNETMYQPDHSTWIHEEGLTDALCGKSRPNHFRGVTTIVTKLFNIVLPDVAVFGQKDAQQSMIIRRMVRDLNIPVELVVAPIVREEDGLAMSSRNKYLSAENRINARAISQGLCRADKAYQEGVREGAELLKLVTVSIEQSGGRIDYVQLVSQNSLTDLLQLTEPAIIAVAAFFGSTRLIDNHFLN